MQKKINGRSKNGNQNNFLDRSGDALIFSGSGLGGLRESGQFHRLVRAGHPPCCLLSRIKGVSKS